jgi:hypothetical protein
MAALLPAIPVARRFRFLSNAEVGFASSEKEPGFCQEIAAAVLFGKAERICSARKMWITALAIPQKQSQMKPFAGAPIMKKKVNSHV